MDGSGTTTIGSGGSLSYGANNPGLNRLLVNNGSTTWTGGIISMSDGTFQNNGSFTANSNGNLYSYGEGAGSGGVFDNAGTFTKLGTGYAQFYNNGSNLVFNNTGTVDVQAGDLYLSSNGSHTGDFALVAATTLWLNGTHTFAATSDVSGAGTVNVYGGTTNFNGQLSAGNTLLVSGGTVNFNSATIAGRSSRGRHGELQQHDHRGRANDVVRRAQRDGERHVYRHVDLDRRYDERRGPDDDRLWRDAVAGHPRRHGLSPAARGQRGNHDLGRRELGDDGRHVPEQRQLHGHTATLLTASASTVAAACSTTRARSPSWAPAASGSIPPAAPVWCSTTRAPWTSRRARWTQLPGHPHGRFFDCRRIDAAARRQPELRRHQPHYRRRHVNVFSGTTTFNGQLSSSTAWLINGGTVNFDGTTTGAPLTLSSTLSGSGNVTFAAHRPGPAARWMAAAPRRSVRAARCRSRQQPGSRPAVGQQWQHDLDRRHHQHEQRHVPEQRQLHGQ